MKNTLITVILTLAALMAAGYSWYAQHTLFLENEQIKAENAALLNAQQQLRNQITLLKDEDTVMIPLTDGSDKVLTHVYHNVIREATALDIGGVPAPPAGKFLQAWARVKDGQLVSIGMIPPTAVGSWQPLKFVADAEGFQISLDENPNGDERPTIVLMVGGREDLKQDDQKDR